MQFLEETSCLEITPRIIGGENARPGQFPHHASVKSWDRSHQLVGLCSGSLVGDQWVLTAASCVQTGNVIEVGLGSNRIDEPTLSLNTHRVHIHPDYDNQQDVRYNIALLEFKAYIPYSQNIRPILLNGMQHGKSKYGDETILISGFGKKGKRFTKFK